MITTKEINPAYDFYFLRVNDHLKSYYDVELLSSDVEAAKTEALEKSPGDARRLSLYHYGIYEAVSSYKAGSNEWIDDTEKLEALSNARLLARGKPDAAQEPKQEPKQETQPKQASEPKQEPEANQRPLKSFDKIKKGEAFEIVKQIRAGLNVTPAAIDDLLLYFAPSIPSKPKTAWQWLAKGVAKKDARWFLELIHVVDGKAYATDGHQMRAINTELSDGLYDPKTGLEISEDNYKGSLDSALKLSNRWPAMFRDAAKSKAEGLELRLDMFHQHIDNKMVKYYVNDANEIAINASILEPVLLNTDNKFYKDKESPNRYYIENEFGQGLVMGIRENPAGYEYKK